MPDHRDLEGSAFEDSQDAVQTRSPQHRLSYGEVLESLQTATGVQGSVLVVDDDPSVCRVVAKAIQRKYPDLKVKTETSGASALASLGREWPDVLILDMYIPDVGGQVIASFLRRREDSERPVHLIAMSGVRPEETREKALAWTPEIFLMKPIDTRALVEHIGGMLGDRGER